MIKKTGVFATKDEAENIRCADICVNPYSGHNSQTVCHEYALVHGLSEIPGYYGLDQNNEFIKMVKEPVTNYH